MNFKEYLENKCHKLRLSPDQRIHTSIDSSLEFVNPTSHKISDKPNGLWYGCGSSWIEWCEYEKFNTKNLQHKFLLDLDFTKILILDNDSKIKEFAEEYGDTIKELEKFKFGNKKYKQYINWNMVAKNFSGIEICPYSFPLRMQLDWYYSWDVASGCVWNKNAIKNITKLN